MTINTENENTENKYFDSEGNRISKTSFKHLQKAKLKTTDSKEIDPALDGAKYYENRLENNRYMKSCGENPYPHKFNTLYQGIDVSCSIAQFCQTFDKLKLNESVKDQVVCLMGRVKLIRSLGTSLRFYVIEADDSSVQLFAQKNVWSSHIDFEKMIEKTKRGDIIGARGYPGRTKTGELSLMLMHLEVLSPCLRPMPSFKYGFKEQELRYRQRYLDFIINPEKRHIFYVRSRVVNYIRHFLDERGFLEVETPILGTQVGGANARPFATHHNELGLPMFMRIATELNLKMLVIGGIDRVYEIGRQFRNEGIDMTHNPEFTTCEFYWAYRDYEDLITVTEEMLSGLVKEINGSMILELDDKEGRRRVIDFTPPFRRVDFITGIETAGGFEIPRPLESEATRLFLLDKCKELGMQTPEPPTIGRLLDKLCEFLVESRIEGPTFLVNHPTVISPLAKFHRENPELVERFEFFVLGKELINAYTELNDPEVQRERFLDQARNRHLGDEESMQLDEDFLLALEYGLPPTAGWGLGIDRLTMFLTNTCNIKEVLLFPAMKPIIECKEADEKKKDLQDGKNKLIEG